MLPPPPPGQSLLYSTKTIHNNSICEKVSETYNKISSIEDNLILMMGKLKGQREK